MPVSNVKDAGTAGEYVIECAFEKIGSGSSSVISKVSTWENTGTVDASYLFQDNPHNIIFNDTPPGTIENMQGMFSNARAFNRDISNWDTSNVTDMSHMFSQRGIGPMSISSGVENMVQVSYTTTGFNQDISNWDTSSVKDMSYMFQSAMSFNNGGQPLDWDVSSVTNMEYMFEQASSFNQDLSGWDVSNVTEYNSFSSGSALTTAHLPKF